MDNDTIKYLLIKYKNERDIRNILMEYINNKNRNVMLQKILKVKINEIDKKDKNKIIDKASHRKFCIENIDLIKNIIIPEISKNLKYETVLIEFRIMPHLEFLIRNTIIKLPSWSHTIVCGNINYEFIVNMCNNISTNIKIIKLDINNLTTSLYSELLMTTDFWNNFIGEKILLYQEDSILFHNKIEEFLKYDYIGAPWHHTQDDNAYGVGNGGFSLRSKNKMIECIEKIKPTDLKLGKSTIRYLKRTNSTCIPEDVYFSKSLIDFNLGIVSKKHHALKFSQESVISINPLGGHNYWLSNKNIIPFNNLKLINNFNTKTQYKRGWKFNINNLINNKIINNKSSNLLLIDCCESYFLFNQNNYISDSWYGIIHSTNNLPKYLENESISTLINNNIFKQSLQYCKGLICLSAELKSYIKKNIKDVNVYSLYYPIKNIKSKFNINNFFKNKNYNIIQLGVKFIKMSTIYRLNLPNKKIWLTGKKNNSQNNNKYFKNIINENKLENFNFNIDKYKTVIQNCTKSIEEYDNLLKNNIIIIPLWGTFGYNYVLEIIEMNIPAFITKLPETEEYLGKEYPMFFYNHTEIEEIIKNKTLFEETYKKTHLYLKNMDKSKYSLKYFNSELLKIVNKI